MLKTILITIACSALLVFGIFGFIYFSTTSSKNSENVILETTTEINTKSNTDNKISTPTPPKISITASSSHQITACQNITTSGTYVVNRDLDDETEGCLTIENTKDIIIDCNNHTVFGAPAVKFTNVQNFSLKSCQLKKLTALGGQLYSLQIEKSSYGDISQNDFGINSYVELYDSNNIQFYENKINAYVQSFYGTYNIFEKNTFVLPNPKGIISGSIVLQYGSHNIIRNNNIDGGAKGIFENQDGVDDGVVIMDEHDDIVDSNSIKNVWDCGIETTGIISNTVFNNNSTTNSGLCGIGAWYFSSWLNNTVSNNIFENTQQPFLFFRSYGFRPAGFDNKKLFPADTVSYFKDNTFSKNIFKNPRSTSYSPYYIDIGVPPALSGGVTGETMPQKSAFITGNNIFSGNDFGLVPPLSFSPKNIVVDGGGNVCRSSPVGYEINCEADPD